MSRLEFRVNRLVRLLDREYEPTKSFCTQSDRFYRLYRAYEIAEAQRRVEAELGYFRGDDRDK